jgi:hypothetical protein
MREAYYRCQHCGTVYTAFLSGGYPGAYTNTNHCPDCYETIRAALEKIPRRFEQRLVETKDLPAFENVRLEHILEWEKEENVTAAKVASLLRSDSQPKIRRLAFPLFDLENPDNINNARWVQPRSGPHKGCNFCVSTWSQKSDCDSIRVEVEWDLFNDKYVAPWRSYR